MRKTVLSVLAIALIAFVVLTLNLGSPPEFHFPAAMVYDNAPAERFQIVTVQMRWALEDYVSPEAFHARIDGLIESGMTQCDPALPTLVVFPEDVGLPLTMMKNMASLLDIRDWEEAATYAVMRNGPAVLWNRWKHGVGTMRAFALSQSPRVGQVYVKTFSDLARKHGVYIVAGSAPLPEFDLDENRGRIRFQPQSSDVFNVAYVFGPDGRILDEQRKVYLIDLESAAGIDLSNGSLDDLSVIETPFGTLGIAVCLDGFRDDVLDRLEALGAEILIQPSANPGEWDQKEQEGWLNSCWKAVQQREAFLCAINPMMTGPLFNMPFEGQSSIAMRGANGAPGYIDAPVDNGFVITAQGHRTEEILVTEFVRTTDGLRVASYGPTAAQPSTH